MTLELIKWKPQQQNIKGHGKIGFLAQKLHRLGSTRGLWSDTEILRSIMWNMSKWLQFFDFWESMLLTQQKCNRTQDSMFMNFDAAFWIQLFTDCQVKIDCNSNLPLVDGKAQVVLKLWRGWSIDVHIASDLHWYRVIPKFPSSHCPKMESQIYSHNYHWKIFRRSSIDVLRKWRNNTSIVVPGFPKPSDPKSRHNQVMARLLRSASRRRSCDVICTCMIKD